MIRQAVAASLDRFVGLTTVCEELGIPRSSVYAHRAREAEPIVSEKRGPKPHVPEAALLASIRADREHVRRLMREHGLQAPGKPQRNLGPRTHDGTITTDKPDQMWGTDATRAMLPDGQQATIFGINDHCTCELLGIHVALIGDRFESITALHQATRAAFGGVMKAIPGGSVPRSR